MKIYGEKYIEDVATKRHFRPDGRDEPPPVNGPEDYANGGTDQQRSNGGGERQQSEQTKARRALPLKWLDMSNWDHEPIPEREWAILNRVPLKQAGLFSGEGGTGKSIIELMKDVSHVAGKDWFGSLPAPGPAFYIGAEDDERELHIRLAAIAKHYRVTLQGDVRGVDCQRPARSLFARARCNAVRRYRQERQGRGDEPLPPGLRGRWRLQAEEHQHRHVEPGLCR